MGANSQPSAAAGPSNRCGWRTRMDGARERAPRLPVGSAVTARSAGCAARGAAPRPPRPVAARITLLWPWRVAAGGGGRGRRRPRPALAPPTPPPSPALSGAASVTALTTALDKVRSWATKAAASGGAALPPLFQRRPPGAPDLATALGVADAAPSWDDVRAARGIPSGLARGDRGAGAGRWPPPKPASRSGKPAAAAAKASPAGGRTYTSRYRGVHQTFPTRRWEAQFRRGGRPTSLGCFDEEEQAARAYDRMMLWCELHGAGGAKGGLTNFDPAEYAGDLPSLRGTTQDALVAALRAEGRKQAADRAKAAKAAKGGGKGGDTSDE